ncbi:MAG: hypothetical protein ABSH20_07550 [Tepidisphaeraceae bacterium]
MMVIEIDDPLARRLQQAAASEGSQPDVLAKRLLDKTLPLPNRATLALLAQWEADEAPADSAERARRQVEGEQFMQELAADRVESEGAGARKLWP